MYLVDVNVLVYALHSGVPQHAPCKLWLDRNLAGHPQSVALP
jgi:predicted nucleic acid-binding protein